MELKEWVDADLVRTKKIKVESQAIKNALLARFSHENKKRLPNGSYIIKIPCSLCIKYFNKKRKTCGECPLIVFQLQNTCKKINGCMVYLRDNFLLGGWGVNKYIELDLISIIWRSEHSKFVIPQLNKIKSLISNWEVEK